MTGDRRRRRRAAVPVCIMAVLAAVIAVCIYMLGQDAYEVYEQEKPFREAAEEDSPFDGYGDMVAWLTVDGTHIDYPVMQNDDDGQYYLHRNMDGEYDYAGVPFLDMRCSTDSSLCLVIFGHNMLNTTMFSDLLKFEDGDFCRKHGVISLLARGEESPRKYRIVASARINAVADQQIYHFTGTLGMDQDALDRFMEDIKELSCYYSDDTDADCSRQMVLLSTCAYHEDNGRFIVLGIREE